jgi:asparagine synthase (glutamine-hydrolysing)
MCGISVIVNLSNAPIAENTLQKMNQKIRHRGPDHEGSFFGRNFALGNQRLSIVDRSTAANQPMHYRELVITYNGEVYNYREIRGELQKKGYCFNTCSDTETILAAFDHWGEKCTEHFEGMWAFIIYDKRSNKLFASRDRFGQKPLYYATVAGHFVMGSEIKQFAVIPGFKGKMNHSIAFDFLNFSALNHTDETFFEGVENFPAGHSMVYDLETHDYELRRWYHFPSPDLNGISLTDAAVEFKKLFKSSVEGRLKADVKLGSCLSGGLDSSSIVCMVNDLETEKSIPVTISVCWPGKEIDEQEYIDIVVDQLKCGSKKITPDLDEMNKENVLDKIIYHQDQPIVSASHYAEYKLYEEAARENLRVMLDGQGADEYLAGYTMFHYYHMYELFNRNGLKDLYKEWNAVRSLFRFSNHKLLRNLLYIRYRRKNRKIDPLFNDKWIKKFPNSDPNLLPGNGELNLKGFTKHQLFVSSLPYQLHSADRNSMCHSVEARLPFLDHRLVEFTYALPARFKIRNGMTKLVLRDALKEILPDRISQRISKQGFPAPEREWMCRNADWVIRELKDAGDLLNNMLDPGKTIRKFQDYCKTGQGDLSLFFRIINLSRWIKLFSISV